MRVEHWANALQPGPGRRARMLGQPDAYDRLPYFFSDQYDVGMEYSGYARRVGPGRLPRRPRRAASSSPSGSRGTASLAGMNVNVWDVTDPIQRSSASASPVDDRRLADPDVPLEELVPETGRERRMNRLQELHDAGVSIWLDTLSRDLLER